MTLPLSVLDLSPALAGRSSAESLRNTLDLARLADRLGYTRYWLAEHHNLPSVATSAPEIMIGHVADATAYIRVGAGGIMLPNHAPLKVVETFRLLEALHPGRIDLGIGRAPGTDPMTALALRRSRAALGADDFPEQLADLFAFGGSGQFPPNHPFRAITAMPDDVELPPVWLLGSSGYSAEVAAMMGLGFAFAHHFSPEHTMPAMLSYREHFRPSIYLAAPHAIVTAAVICGETPEQADVLAAPMDLTWLRRQQGRFGPLPTPEEALSYPYTAADRAQITARRAWQLVGDPALVKAQVLDLVARTRADELMVTTMVYDHAARRRSYELLAELFELPARAPAQPA